MISASQILEYVSKILKDAERPMVAGEICSELCNKGVIIEKTTLNQILWKENIRPDLVVDNKTFKWHYDSNAAKHTVETEERLQKIRREVTGHADFLQLWENIGFEFIGVAREGTARPLFFIREEGGEYLLVGPMGNLLREKSIKCSEPEPMSPAVFTVDQLKKAAEEIIAERRRQAIADAHEIISKLRDTELFSAEVYCGPAIENIEDVIPVSGVIFIAKVAAALPDTIEIGWGTVLEPLYLIVEILGLGNRSDTRYGVFKLCVYELLKRNIVVEHEDGLSMTVTLQGDRVYIGAGSDILKLSK